MKTIKNYEERYNRWAESPESYKVLSGDMPAIPFDEDELRVEENVTFPFSNCTKYNLFLKKNYTDKKIARIHDEITCLADHIFGTGSRCVYMSRGLDKMKAATGLGWVEMYTLLRANFFSKEEATAQVSYMLTSFIYL